ncbi:hypothetical protein LCGC14_2185650 [marine sediment metagenome]|uniref:Uncharacterized protein n=1 Tax=marine sediment metagenome TaxID=412755 RepID=A0A0F9DL14_9ZZZZ
MIITKKSYDEIKIADLITLNFDLLIKYKLENDVQLRTIPIQMRNILWFFKNNLGENLIDLLKYYLSTKLPIKILNIMKYKHTTYKLEDFRIKLLTKRVYGNMLLFYVNVYNRKTGVFFEDWVRPSQIQSIKIINQLICWECEGDEIDFFN